MPLRRPPPGTPAAATVARVTAAIDAFCARERMPATAAWRLRVALDELLANLGSHGGPAGLPSVEVSLCRESDHIDILVTDDGPPFDPLGSPPPDLTSPLEARQPGGLGIHLVKALVEDIRYEWRDGNRLTLRLRIGAADGTADEDAHADSTGDA
jgi:serine/threonine-protein kinase RsbW